MRVLLLEDDLELGAGLARSMTRAGFDVQWVRMVSEAQRVLMEDSIALAILDIGVPDGSGLDLLLWLRRRGLRLPVMMLTARSGVADRVHGLDDGADDYLSKPVAIDELLSRMRALVRRSGGYTDHNLMVGRIHIDPEQRQVSLDGKRLNLSLNEYTLLIALASRPGRVLTRAQLENALRVDGDASSNSLEVIMHRLRRKLGGASMIRTIRGIGYVIDAKSEADVDADADDQRPRAD